MNIWDAEGDANVHNLAHLFLKDAKVGILVYSIDNKNSFDQLKDWVEHLDNEENLFIVIVGNKSDLAPNRAVPAVFAQRFQQHNPRCKFVVETSAHEDIDSINRLFDMVSREIIEGGYYS